MLHVKTPPERAGSTKWLPDEEQTQKWKQLGPTKPWLQCLIGILTSVRYCSILRHRFLWPRTWFPLTCVCLFKLALCNCSNNFCLGTQVNLPEKVWQQWPGAWALRIQKLMSTRSLSTNDAGAHTSSSTSAPAHQPPRSSLSSTLVNTESGRKAVPNSLPTSSYTGITVGWEYMGCLQVKTARESWRNQHIL